MVESLRVPGKPRIGTSIEKLSRRVPKKGRICVSTEIWWNPGEYWEKVESLRVSKNCPDEYSKTGRVCVRTEKWQNSGEHREKVESVRVSQNCPC